MELAIALVASLLFATIFKRAIKAVPLVFYVLAIIAVLLYFLLNTYSLAPAITRALNPYIQRCLFAFSLFAIVMFIGVLKDGSSVRRYFMPIRGNLSIIAALLTLAHIINYFNAYLYQFLSGFSGMAAPMIISFVVSAILIVGLAILTVTSFNYVRKRMNAARWKRLQLLAYPFFILIYVHLMLILVPFISAYNQKAFISICIYTVLLLAYLVLRLRKRALDKNHQEIRKEQGIVN